MKKHICDPILIKLPIPLDEARKFTNYCIIGGLSAGLDFIVFSIFTKFFDWKWLIANCLSVTVGILTSFTLNATLNFKTTDNLLRRFLQFFATGMLGLIVASSCIYVFHEFIGIDEIISKLLSIILVTFLQYSLNKKFSFKSTNNED